jgi:hypothetical protein
VADTSRTGTINVSDQGRVEIDFVKQLQGQLAGVVKEPTWTLPRLANWIDTGIVHPDVTKPSAKFYPDFVAMLTDGRIVVVEYKGQHLYEAEAVKRRIGEVWADASNGRCLFCMPTARDYSLIDRTIG